MQAPSKTPASPKQTAKTLKIFLTHTLPVAKQARYKHKEIAVATAEMLEAHKTPTEAARKLGINHTRRKAPRQSEARSRAQSPEKGAKAEPKKQQAMRRRPPSCQPLARA